ncbi:MAG: hypothetical protein J6T59_01320 [Bacteroidales bacterium]|nr:hypothetical protein [Bacteroidales bacterium]
MEAIANKDEYMVLLMLYVANLDGKIKPDEMSVILEKSTPADVVKVRKLFNTMNDSEILQLLQEKKELYVRDDSDKQVMLADIRKLIEADRRIGAMETFILGELEQML